jgi:transcriptional regulator with XRE-family HTH domain
MRKSNFKHPLAILRTSIGLSQREMANLLECSAPAVQSIELGRLVLSDGLASRIADETGVDLGWLKKGDPSAPPIDRRGAPFTKPGFERWRAARAGEKLGLGGLEMIDAAITLAFVQMGTACLAACETSRVPLFCYKISETLGQLAKEFATPHCVASVAYFQESSSLLVTCPRVADTARFPGLAEAVKLLAISVNRHYSVGITADTEAEAEAGAEADSQSNVEEYQRKDQDLEIGI